MLGVMMVTMMMMVRTRHTAMELVDVACRRRMVVVVRL